MVVVVAAVRRPPDRDAADDGNRDGEELDHRAPGDLGALRSAVGLRAALGGARAGRRGLHRGPHRGRALGEVERALALGAAALVEDWKSCHAPDATPLGVRGTPQMDASGSVSRSQATVWAIPSWTPMRASHPNSRFALSTEGQRRTTSTSKLGRCS